MIDIHNHYGRQSLLAIEKVWRLQISGSVFFQFILLVSVVNSYLAYCYFLDKPHTFLIDFVDVLASELCWPKRQSPSPNFEEMFPSINSKGSGRCKVVGPNGKIVVQRLTTFAYLGMNRSQSYFTCVGPVL